MSQIKDLCYKCADLNASAQTQDATREMVFNQMLTELNTSCTDRQQELYTQACQGCNYTKACIAEQKE